MKRTLLLSIAALTVFSVAPASAGLIVNGSFEQGPGGIGSFTGWQTVLGDAATFVDSSGLTGPQAGEASDGLWSAYFGSTEASGGSSISQTFSTVAGDAYLLTFDLANDNGGGAASNSFEASIDNGAPTFSLSDILPQDYANEQVLFIASGATTTLTFSAFNDEGYVQLDHVNVTPTPEPSGFALVLAGALALSLTAAGRSLVRNWLDDRNQFV